MAALGGPGQIGLGQIGLGLLGSALAGRFLQAGFSVVGYDTDPERREAFRSLGGQPAASAAEVAQSSQRIVLSLPTSDTVASVLEEI